eukprot:ctg_3902.g810
MHTRHAAVGGSVLERAAGGRGGHRAGGVPGAVGAATLVYGARLLCALRAPAAGPGGRAVVTGRDAAGGECGEGGAGAAGRRVRTGGVCGVFGEKIGHALE